MSPSPKEPVHLDSASVKMESTLPDDAPIDYGEEIVISGVSGSFPDSDGVYMFRDKLMAKINLVSDDERRWKKIDGDSGYPHATGKMYNIDKFDAGFFGVQAKQGDIMDPLVRITLERVFESILDAGVNPRNLRGTRTGVFTGTSFSETERVWFFDNMDVNGLGILNCSRALTANRVSYFFGLEGPSLVTDTACSSSLFALDRAVESLRSGQCDAAIVVGATVCLHPFVSKQFNLLGVLSDDSKCRCFDEKANGYARSEGVVALFIQKAKDARRSYARIVHSKVNCDGYKDSGITFPSRAMQLQLLQDFYAECKVDPTTVSYVEAHATGTQVGDPEESNAIDQAFCTGRKEPLLIGSVKSNMGHSEPASGLCSVVKAIIAMETGLIPPNINYKQPKPDIPGILEGRMKVVTEPTPLPGENGLVAVSSFGFGGANAHVLFEWNKKKEKTMPRDNIPRLVAVSGRTPESVGTILDDIKGRPLNMEYLQLINDVFSDVIDGHQYRGYAIYTMGGEKYRTVKPFNRVPGEKTAGLTLVLPGIGGNVPYLARSLLKLPPFRASVEDLHENLLNVKFDLMSVITEESVFSANITNTLVGVIAFQMALLDCLAVIGVVPNTVLGYSIGELSCAYFCRNLTAQQAIQSAYHIGKTLLDFQKIFSENLSDVHTKNVDSIFNNVIKCLEYIIPAPQPRRDNWITSLKKIFSHGVDVTSQCSPEFFAHVITSSLDLNAAKMLIPKENIIVEVNSRNEPLFGEKSLLLTDANATDNSIQFLTTIGNLYTFGIDVSVAGIYPRLPYPVSRSTPMIAPLIRWDHSKDWFVVRYDKTKEISAGEYNVQVNLNTINDAHLKGHVIDGRTLYPATGYVNLMIDQMASLADDHGHDNIYVFRNVQFHRATTLSSTSETIFRVSIQKASGKFEISEGGSVIVTGMVEVCSPTSPSEFTDPALMQYDVSKDGDKTILSTKDIYKELRLRGYHYTGLFRGLVQVSSDGVSGKVKWNDNLVAFMDTMLQMQILNSSSRDLYVPVAIGKIVIDIKSHVRAVETAVGFSGNDRGENITLSDTDLDIHFNKDINVIKSGGIEIWNLRAQQIPRRKPLGEPVLEKYSFVPFIIDMPKDDLFKAEENFAKVLRLQVHLALENLPGIKVKVLELTDNNLPIVSGYVAAVLLDLPLIQADVKLTALPSDKTVDDLPANVSVVEDALTSDAEYSIIIGKDLLSRTSVLEKAQTALKPGGFFITRDHPDSIISETDFTILAQYTTNGEKFSLLRKKVHTIDSIEVIKIGQNNDFSWVEELKSALLTKANRIILVSEKDDINGIIGLTNCLLQESSSKRIRCFYIRDDSAPAFDIKLPVYAEQLAKDLAINIYEDGHWGTYRHQALADLSLVPSQHVFVNNGVRGDISSLTLFQGPLNNLMMKGEIGGKKLIKICYAAINFRDVMLSSGKITLPSTLTEDNELQIGIEFSGINADGERVMGLMGRGAMTTVLENPIVTWRVPDNMSLADAATIPCVYTTVYLCLVVNGKAKAGESILIHSGAGGIGLAAINMALKIGLSIFVTVGTEDKRKYLLDTYPQISDSHIGNSRDTSFLDMIMRETDSKGVDIVLNSLADEKMEASARCLAVGGRFLEIGKYDLLKNSAIDMGQFLKGGSFHAIMVDVALEGNKALKNMIFGAMDECFKNGFVEPLPKTVFDMNEPEKAIRYMTTGKHIGKVLMKVREEHELTDVKLFDAVPRFFCNPKGTYIIIGGLGGFGLELANWLVSRGANFLVVTSRQGIQTGFQSRSIEIWRRSGVKVEISTENISTEEGVTNLLQNANAMAPIAAIFNLAVVLSDAVFENQTKESFKISFSGKANATLLLDRISRKLCPLLEQFVVFSSVSCGRGNAGQTNYGMANSVMERICEKRKAEGFPALAIQWGAIGEVGLVAEMAESNLELVIGGTLQQTISSCLQTLDKFLSQDAPVVASMVVAEKRSTRKAGDTIVDAVCFILGIKDIKTVSPNSSLSEVGMDSMTGVEIKQTLERDFEVFLTAQDLRGMTFAKLAALDASQNQTRSETTSDEVGLRFLITSILPEDEAGIVTCEFETSRSEGKPLILVPGMDGIVSSLAPLAKGLQYPAISVRYPHNLLHLDSIQDTASFMLSNISNSIDKNDFKLLGYSAGGCVALEMAAILEKQGGIGHIILIDGAPIMLSALIKLLGVSGEPAHIDNTVILALQENLTLSSVTQDRDKYISMKTREEKLDYLKSVVGVDVSNSSYTDEYLRLCAGDLMQRVHNIVNYSRTDIRLKSKITLIKPSSPTCPSVEDFGLNQMTDGPTEVMTITGNHISMLQAPELSTLINNIFN